MSESAKPRKKLTLAGQEIRDGLRLLAPSLLIIFVITSSRSSSHWCSASSIHRCLTRCPETSWGLAIISNSCAASSFWQTIGRTVYFTVVSVGMELVLGLAIATLIHSHPPGWNFLRTSLIIPWAVPTIVNGTMWRWIYNADYGALNGVLYSAWGSSTNIYPG